MAKRKAKTRPAKTPSKPRAVPQKVIEHLDAAIKLMAAPKVDVAATQRALIWLSQATSPENMSQNA